ncbi:MAG: DUF6442 family protein [Chitinophagales bacterium]
MKNSVKDYCLVMVGLMLTAAGLAMVKMLIEPQGIMRALPYVCIGIGCGIFGQSMGNVIRTKTLKNSPDIHKQIEIEEKDERNITIANRAKAKSYDMMVFVFGALLVSFALMGIDMIAVLLLVFAYLFVIFYGIYYRQKYDKEM